MVHCKHKKAAKEEMKFVIERIMNKSYLFEPPCCTRNGRQFHNSYISLYDVKAQKRISWSEHSLSREFISVLCQRCGPGVQNHFNVYLDKVYERMVKEEIIKEYPEIEEVSDGKSFTRYYLKI